MTTIITNVYTLDVRNGTLSDAPGAVRVAGGKIVGVGATAADAGGDGAALVVDGKGGTLMPGLIDCHVHVTAWSANFRALASQPATYTTARAAGILRAMLARGFTSVRDAGGADYGLARAVDEGLLPGPKIYFCGHALSQTGGHGDVRGAGECAPCMCSFGTVCDGVAEVRKACREEIRKGAHQIKLMVSGGVASPCDRIDSTQFSAAELRAAVEEARAANVPVMAHAYTARAIGRALEAGVTSIEHGNLLDADSVRQLVAAGAFLVPTLSTYAALAAEGLQNGMPADQHAKVATVLDAGLRALRLAHAGGARIAFGTDLLGDMHRHQLGEFRIRAAVCPLADVIRSATLDAAALLGVAGLGVVEVGAAADLIVVAGNPLLDVGVLEQPKRFVMKAGEVCINEF